MNDKYLFKSQRLGFRVWQDTDIAKMIKISSDPNVMEFFPAIASAKQTTEFVGRMKIMFDEKGFCYFPVDELSSGNFIGFIGLCYQSYKAEFTPCVDIGWRLSPSYWNKGYATEGAQACLEYAFNKIGLKNIKAIASKINVKSIKVMEKIGMKKQLEFNHLAVAHDKRLKSCVCYEIANESY
ncbi:MAG: GNAT family N-acetyltransferase [Reichenbachiella sp.]|uniref:GNAT family N-acetyltransferase n=1 Tax=Reichenbachiella sp. TaxID=2184521 RepID=UPI0032643AFF